MTRTSNRTRRDTMIAVEGLTKRYGHATVVDDLSFQVLPGRVTGFLGPNGTGKTQTIKMILGLVHPTAGRATVAGRPLAEHRDPSAVVGAVLDGGAFHPGRTARDALRIHAAVAGVQAARVDELLGRVGLGDAAGRRLGTYSLGMRQRLALAQGLLADPAVLIADEPANGLDPAGIAWMRRLLRELADQGKTVFVSSHLLPEAERLVDDVVLIARGRLVRRGPLSDLRRGGPDHVGVRAADAQALTERLRRLGLTVTADGSRSLLVSGADAATVGNVAAGAGIPLERITQLEHDLEDWYLHLTAGQGLEDR